jgi:hypothetical protein
VTLEARQPPLLVIETKEKQTIGVNVKELKTKTTIVQLAGLPLFLPNPLSVQLSFKGLQITLLFSLTSQRDAYARCLFTASKNIFVSSEAATVEDLRSSMGTAVYKSGFLCKRGDVVKSWKMRFFVLRPGDLSYFETKDDALHGETPLNIYYLKGATIEKVPYSKHNKSCVIEITFAASSGNSARSLLMEAADDAECDEWVQALNSHRDTDSDRSRVVVLDDVDQVTGEGGQPLCPDDFELESVIGRGAWGKVYRAKHKPSGILFALKVMKKKALIDENLARLIITERQLMSELLHPFICTLHGHFQTASNLFMVLR